MFKYKRRSLVYDYELANECFKEFRKNNKGDLYDTSRKDSAVRLRSLFCNVLKEYLSMNDRMISEFLATKGINISRSAIFHGRSRTELYYNACPYFRKMYDAYFSDRIKIEKPTLKPKVHKDALDKLIDSLPFDKRGDIYEMVNLRVKSWSWKNNDKCQVIVGSGNLDGTF